MEMRPDNVDPGGRLFYYMAKNTKKNLLDYLNLAKKNGIEMIGDMPKNAAAKTLWRCPIGHEWQTTYYNIRSGTNCPTCSNDAKRMHFEIDYRNKAKELGYEFIGPMPQAADYKTKWRCSKRHEWNASFTELRGCPFCAINGIKLPEDYHALAKNLAFQWVGPIVKNGHTKTNWICDQGHPIFTTYSNLLEHGGCYLCIPNRPKNEFDYYALAKEKGIRYIGPFPESTMSKTRWICSAGHIIEKTYHSIAANHICRKCYLIKNTGTGNPNWRGGQKMYTDGFTDELKEYIRTRDNRTCQVCGEKESNAERLFDVHHIIPARYAPIKLRHKKENLITLCRHDHPRMESNLSESIPLLRKVLVSKYSYSYKDIPLSYLPN